LREKRGLEEERRDETRETSGVFFLFSQKKKEGEVGSSFSSLLLDVVEGRNKREKRGLR